MTVPSGPLDPVAAAIVEGFRAFPAWQALLTNPIAETRAALRALPPPHELRAVDHIADFRVPVAGGDIGLRLYRPVPKPRAIIIWAHGGGFALGSIAESDSYARWLAAETGCAVASVEYRLAPEHKFPIPVDDVLMATQWVAARRKEFAGGDVPLVLGGDSAGANLATVVTRKLHETKALRIAANVLAYPSTDNADAPSLQQFEAPFLTAKEITFFLNQYAPDSRNHPDVAPLYAANLSLLPPTFIVTAEHDLITAQAEAYGKKLAAAGVDVTVRRYPGMIHGFLTLDPFFPGPAGTAMREFGAFITRVTK